MVIRGGVGGVEVDLGKHHDAQRFFQFFRCYRAKGMKRQ
jgi:hypothetical protein